MKTVKATTATLAIAAITCCVFAQGNLTPPPGVPSATMKTLEQVEPRIDLATVAGNANYHHVISQPGSYYLSGNLAVTNIHGIMISVSGVTLDLKRFQISRSFGSGGNGVDIRPGIRGASIYNGSIRGFGYGIFANYFPYPKDSVLSGLTVSDCSQYGIFVPASSLVTDCIVCENTGAGIFTSSETGLKDVRFREPPGHPHMESERQQGKII